MSVTAKIHLGPNAAVQGYRIVECEHGVAVFGLVPLSDLPGLQLNWKERGFDILDMAVASAIDATLCATNEKGSKEWREEVLRAARRRATCSIGTAAEVEWAYGLDTGLSSLQLLSVLGDNEVATGRARNKIYQMKGGLRVACLPDDAEALGKCLRLLDLFPDWRSRLAEVAERYTAWGPLVRAWSELEAVYLRGDRREIDQLLSALAATSNSGRPESSSHVDLSAVIVTGTRGEAAVHRAIVENPDDIPSHLYLTIQDSVILYWSRDPESPGIYNQIEKMLDEALDKDDKV